MFTDYTVYRNNSGRPRAFVAGRRRSGLWQADYLAHLSRRTCYTIQAPSPLSTGKGQSNLQSRADRTREGSLNRSAVAAAARNPPQATTNICERRREGEGKPAFISGCLHVTIVYIRTRSTFACLREPLCISAHRTPSIHAS